MTLGHSSMPHGGLAALEEYFSCATGGFNGYAKVESGSEKWLNIAVRLLQDADGCYAEGLHDSIARAFPAAPQRVLRLVNSTPFLTAESICLPFMDDDEDPSKHLAYLRSLERSPSRGSRPSL